MTNTDRPNLSTMTHAERLAYFSAARLDTPPIMPAVVNRPAPPRPPTLGQAPLDPLTRLPLHTEGHDGV